MINIPDEIAQMVEKVKERYTQRIQEARNNSTYDRNTGNFKEIIQGEVAKEIVSDIEYIEKNGFPDIEYQDKLLITPEVCNCSSNRIALRQLIEIDPAFAVLSSQEITNDERNLESFSHIEPMTIVHLYGQGKISKTQFLKEIHKNPVVLQNFCAYGDYGLTDQEMLDAVLYQEDNRESYDSRAKQFNGYDVFGYCVVHDFEDYEYSDKQIEYVAKYALTGYLGTVDNLIKAKHRYERSHDIESRDFKEQVKDMLIKYPQAIKAMDPDNIENFDARGDLEEIRYMAKHTDEPIRKEEYEKSLHDFEALFDEGHCFWKEIKEAMHENPQVREIFFMSDAEFSNYMNDVEHKKDSEIETRDSKEAIKQRIMEKSDEYRKLRDRNNRREF